MYRGTFERSDLFGVITNDELTKVETRLLQTGEPTPTATNIVRAVATFNRYAAKYQVEEDAAKRHIGALVVFFMFERLQAVPPGRQKAYDDTMTELRAIRDGKFTDMPLDGEATPTESAPAPGRFGGKRRIETR